MNIHEILKNIDNGYKINTRFREYHIMFEKFFVDVSPYVIVIFKYGNIIYDDFHTYNLYKKYTNRYHNNDYEDGSITFSPCDIYEYVSGFNIHTKNELEYDITNEKICEEYDQLYKINQTKFINLYNNRIRKEKLNRILND